jgi:Ni,Fe-hydrogenase III large subunit/NADH:ubiquinone oxidoreductase subunit C
MTVVANTMNVTAVQLDHVGGGRIGHLVPKLQAASAVLESGDDTQGMYLVPVEHIVPLLRELILGEGGRLATVTGIDVRDGTELVYHVCFDAVSFTANLKTCIPRTTDTAESITPWLPGAEFIEREIHDLLGVTFAGHPRLDRLILADDWPEGVYPLRRGFRKEDAASRNGRYTPRRHTPVRTEKTDGTRRTLVPIGPFHPLQEEPEFYQLWVEGETVVDLDLRISYNHRGIEELSTRRTFDQVPYLVERVCGICSASHPLAYIQAVEKLCQCEVPERALYLRTIVAELERIHSHLLWVGLAGHFLGYNTVFMWAWRYREPIMDILERATGNRCTYANAKIGGSRRDIPDEMLADVIKAVDSVVGPTEMLTNAVLDDPVLHARLTGIATLTEQDARRWCVTGPTARGSGVAIDVRRDDPYEIYDRLDWNVITFPKGDVMAKAKVRLLETLEAAKIIKQAVRQCPRGPIDAKVEEIPPGEAIGHVEAPRGETFHFVRSNGGRCPVRHKIRAPSFVNVPSFRASCIGQHIADVTIALAAVDPCYSCTERMAATADAETGKRLMGGKALLASSQARTRWFEQQLGVAPFDERWGPKLQELLA